MTQTTRIVPATPGPRRAAAPADRREGAEARDRRLAQDLPTAGALPGHRRDASTRTLGPCPPALPASPGRPASSGTDGVALAVRERSPTAGPGLGPRADRPALGPPCGGAATGVTVGGPPPRPGKGGSAPWAPVRGDHRDRLAEQHCQDEQAADGPPPRGGRPPGAGRERGSDRVASRTWVPDDDWSSTSPRRVPAWRLERQSPPDGFALSTAPRSAGVDGTAPPGAEEGTTTMSMLLALALSVALAASPPARTDPRRRTADHRRRSSAPTSASWPPTCSRAGPRPPGATRWPRATSPPSSSRWAFRPAGSEGFLQPFDIVGVEGHAPRCGSAAGSSRCSSGTWTTWWPSPGTRRPRTALEGAELVFVGFGIQAPEYAWDDFKGQDLQGQGAAHAEQRPRGRPVALRRHGRRLYYGRWDYKYESAARAGAAGAIILHTQHSAGYPWQVVQTSWTGPQFSLPTTDRRVPLRGWITEEACRASSWRWPARTSTRSVRAAEPSRLPAGAAGGDGGRRASTTRWSAARTANVLGLLPGSDPRLASEVVLYTAHHDHLGHADRRQARRGRHLQRRGGQRLGRGADALGGPGLRRAAQGAPAEHPLRRGGRRGAGPARLASTWPAIRRCRWAASRWTSTSTGPTSSGAPAT